MIINERLRRFARVSLRSIINKIKFRIGLIKFIPNFWRAVRKLSKEYCTEYLTFVYPHWIIFLFFIFDILHWIQKSALIQIIRQLNVRLNSTSTWQKLRIENNIIRLHRSTRSASAKSWARNRRVFDQRKRTFLLKISIRRKKFRQMKFCRTAFSILAQRSRSLEEFLMSKSESYVFSRWIKLFRIQSVTITQ